MKLFKKNKRTVLAFFVEFNERDMFVMKMGKENKEIYFKFSCEFHSWLAQKNNIWLLCNWVSARQVDHLIKHSLFFVLRCKLFIIFCHIAYITYCCFYKYAVCNISTYIKCWKCITCTNGILNFVKQIVLAHSDIFINQWTDLISVFFLLFAAQRMENFEKSTISKRSKWSLILWENTTIGKLKEVMMRLVCASPEIKWSVAGWSELSSSLKQLSSHVFYIQNYPINNELTIFWCSKTVFRFMLPITVGNKISPESSREEILAVEKLFGLTLFLSITHICTYWDSWRKSTFGTHTYFSSVSNYSPIHQTAEISYMTLIIIALHVVVVVELRLFYRLLL